MEKQGFIAAEKELNDMIDRWLPKGEDYEPGGAQFKRYGRVDIPKAKRRLLTTIYEQYARISQESDALIQAIVLRSIIDLKRELCHIASLGPDVAPEKLTQHVKQMDKLNKTPKSISGADKGALDLHASLYDVLSKCTHQGFYLYHSIPPAITHRAMEVVMGDLFSRLADDPDVGDMVTPEQRERILAEMERRYGPNGPCATCEHWSKRRPKSGQTKEVGKVEDQCPGAG